MIGSDGRLAGKRRDRLRNAPRPGPASSRERQPLDCAIEELGRLLRPIGSPSLQLVACRTDAETHGLRRFARRSSELRCPRPRHRDHEVEPVQESPGELVPECRQPLGRALAVRGRIAPRPARTEVHRRNELEPGRERRPPSDPRDADDTVLERLAERLERGPLELGELVQDEHAPVREADLARPRARGRRRPVQRPKRCSAATAAAGT